MELLCKPIGVIRTGKRVKFDTPHQPVVGVDERNVVELFEGHRYEAALSDLQGFSMVWLIWWFHRHDNWKPRVIPPRGPSVRRGVFATRSPHRPNPIGITAVPLLEVGERSIVVGNVDLLDGTPILDIKPYISRVDAFPDASLGWLGDEDHLFDQPTRYAVELSERAREQAGWLESEWGISFLTKVTEVLSRHPQRSRTYRITSPKNGVARISSGVWRVYFSYDDTVSQDTVVKIHEIAPGYPKPLLFEEGYPVITDWEAQRAFYDRYPSKNDLNK